MTASQSSGGNDFNYETFSLVWLDPQATTLPEYAEIRAKLRSAINYLKLFEDVDQCEQYIRTTPHDDRVVLLVTYPLAQEIIARVHSLRQTASIYIYGTAVDANRQWIELYSKVKCSLLPLDALLSRIRFDQVQQSRYQIDDGFPGSLYSPSLDQNPPSIDPAHPFFSFQLILDCLLRPELDLDDRSPLISFCREVYKNNPTQLNDVDEFERTYSSNQALSLYTKDSFLSRILHKAARFQKIDVLLLFRFLLVDIQRQLNQDHHLSPVQLYRSLVMSDDELQSLKDSIGGFISVHTFFSTKLSRQQALLSFDYGLAPNSLRRVLFAINADPRIDRIQPFSMINSSEVLFMLGSIFRVLDVRLQDDLLWVVRLTLSSPNDARLISRFDSIKRQLGYNRKQVNKLTLGNLLWKMNKLDDAEKYYLYMIDRLPNDLSILADFYYNLGHLYTDKNDYDASLKCHHRSLEIWATRMKSTDPGLADNYNAIATNYWKKGEYQHALESFGKALNIFREAYGENHINVAMCLNNMGTVMTHEKNYSEALECCLKALTIFEKHLPSNHPNLASLHCNISSIYKNLEQIDLALEHLQRSLAIYESVLPSHDPTIVMMLKNIAFLQEQKKDYGKALTLRRRISGVYQQTMVPTDPVVIQNDEKIQYLSSLQD